VKYRWTAGGESCSPFRRRAADSEQLPLALPVLSSEPNPSSLHGPVLLEFKL
jgi:hypothetical protein